MTSLHMVLLIIICIGANVLQSGAETLLHTEGDLVRLQCSLSDTVTYPEWRGPPSLVKYTNQGSSTINQALNASARLSYAENNRDLLLEKAVVADSGEYKCSYVGFGEYTFNLNVSEKTNTVSDCGCKSLNNCDISKGGCIGLWILIAVVILVVIGIVLFFLHLYKVVKFPCGSKTEETKSTANKPQQSHEDAKQILEDGDRKETKSQKSTD